MVHIPDALREAAHDAALAFVRERTADTMERLRDHLFPEALPRVVELVALRDSIVAAAIIAPKDEEQFYGELMENTVAEIEMTLLAESLTRDRLSWRAAARILRDGARLAFAVGLKHLPALLAGL